LNFYTTIPFVKRKKVEPRRLNFVARNVSVVTLDTGYCVLDTMYTGYWMLDTLDTGYWILDTTDTGYWIVDTAYP